LTRSSSFLDALIEIPRTLLDHREEQFTAPPFDQDFAELHEPDRLVGLMLASRDIVDVIAALEAHGYVIST
jgi:hypothetical protein